MSAFVLTPAAAPPRRGRCASLPSTSARPARLIRRRCAPLCCSEGTPDGKEDNAGAKLEAIKVGDGKGDEPARESNFGGVVQRTRDALRSYVQRYTQAKRVADDFRTRSNLVGGDVELDDTAEVEDIQIPGRDAYVSTELSALFEYLRAEAKITLDDTLADVLYDCARCELAVLGRRGREGLRSADTNGLDALYHLLRLAGFRHIHRQELHSWDHLDGYADRLPVALDNDRNQISPFQRVLSRRLNHSNALYPRGLVMASGVGYQRNAGPLLGSKLRALENSLLGWLEAPFNSFVRRVLELKSALQRWVRTTSSRLRGGGDGSGDDGDADAELDADGKADGDDDDEDIPVDESGGADDDGATNGKVPPAPSRSVRRVTVARVWKGGVRSLAQVFLPAVTQEPTSRYLAVVYDDDEQVSTRRHERLTLRIYEDVPFAATTAFIPGAIVIPTTFDALRFDILTIGGLLASLLTVTTNSSKGYVLLLATGTIVQYGARVVFNVTNTLRRYAERTTKLQLQSVLARDAAALLLLGHLAALSVVKTALLCLAELRGDAQSTTGPQLSVAQLRSRVEATLQHSFSQRVNMQWLLPFTLQMLSSRQLVRFSAAGGEKRGRMVQLTEVGRNVITAKLPEKVIPPPPPPAAPLSATPSPTDAEQEAGTSIEH